MRFRPILLVAGAALLLAQCRAIAQAVNGIEVSDGLTASVFNGKQPELRLINADGNTEYAIPIDDHAGQFAFSKSADTVYIAYTAKKGENVLAAVDLKSRQVVKKIPIGTGYFVNLLSFDDTNRLYALTYSGAKSIAYPPYIPQKTLRGQYAPTLTVIDTSTNQVVATYSWLDGFLSGLNKHRNNASITLNILAPSNSKTVSIYTSAFYLHTLKGSVTVFSEGSNAPIANVDVEGRFDGSICSNDGRFELVSLVNEKNTAGSLEVIDLKTGTATNKPLDDPPEGVFRLGSENRLWILEHREMRAVDESGELTDLHIRLDRVAKTNDSSDSQAFVDGYPGETLTIGNDYAAMQINNKNGGSKHKVALINLKQQRIEAILPTMSAAEIAGIRTGRFLLAFGLSMATGGNIIFVPNMSIHNEALAARADGSYLYALDVEGHEVSVFNVRDASVVTRIKVNGDVTRIKVSEDARHLICFGRKTQQIDLARLQLEN
ncbi:MAG TPA: hypothetical protein VMT38_04620 [Terracidiphilus sp.]|nr:hypothetical protein [Terracidiphilus sp.]